MDYAIYSGIIFVCFVAYTCQFHRSLKAIHINLKPHLWKKIITFEVVLLVSLTYHVLITMMMFVIEDEETMDNIENVMNIFNNMVNQVCILLVFIVLFLFKKVHIQLNPKYTTLQEINDAVRKNRIKRTIFIFISLSLISVDIVMISFQSMTFQMIKYGCSAILMLLYIVTFFRFFSMAFSFLKVLYQLGTLSPAKAKIGTGILLFFLFIGVVHPIVQLAEFTKETYFPNESYHSDVPYQVYRIVTYLK